MYYWNSCLLTVKNGAGNVLLWGCLAAGKFQQILDAQN